MSLSISNARPLPFMKRHQVQDNQPSSLSSIMNAESRNSVMPLFVHEHKPKPPSSSHYMHLLQLLRDARTQCRGSCLSRVPSSLSSVDDDGGSYISIDLHNKYVNLLHNSVSKKMSLLSLFFRYDLMYIISSLPQAIIMEIRSRAMKAKLDPAEVLLHREHMITSKEEKRDQECDVANEDDDDSDEGGGAFFSVKSCFSHCSSYRYDEFGKRSVLDDFRDCDGWLFGLCRRAVVLPPLPSSPSDSWQWHKRKLASRTC